MERKFTEPFTLRRSSYAFERIRRSFAVLLGVVTLVTMASAAGAGTPAAAAPTDAAAASAADGSIRNFALGAQTRQSSNYRSLAGDSQQAVDGDTSGTWHGAGTSQTLMNLSSTAQQENPWWEVDLGASRYLNELRVWNRTDCCAQRLSDFWVFMSATPITSEDPAVVAADPAITAVHITSAPNPVAKIPVAVTARYVRIQIPGEQYLSLAEVEAFGPAQVNLAHYARATQSSIAYDGVPGRAIDGSSVGKHSAATVSHTDKTPQPWWQVDIGAARYVEEIRIWNRTDCCRERLSDFFVFTSTKPFASDDPTVLARDPNVLTTRIAAAPDPMTSIPIGAQAEHVRVQLAGSGYLSLAEVEVLGPEPRANFVPDGVATQSSVAFGGDPERAQDGVQDGNYRAGSTTHTGSDAQAWWQVDLGSMAVLNEIRIWNRTDCCANRLSDFYVFTSARPFTSNDPAVLANDPRVSTTRVTSAPSPMVSIPVNTTARYLRVQRAGSGYLSLAEVEAFGSRTLPKYRARLAVAGDVGTGARDEWATATAMDKMEGADDDYDALLLLGDNVYEDGNPARLPAAVFDPFAKVLDGRTRLLAVLGNHDNAYGDRQAPAVGMPGRWYSTEVNGITVVALDSNQPNNPEQLAWLKTTLANSSPTTIVILHHPPYSGGYHGPSPKVQAAFVPLFEQYGVDLVLAGHDHDYQRSAPVNGVTYVVSGAAAKTRETSLVSPMVVATARFSFVDLKVFDDKIQLTTFDQGPEQIDSVTIKLS